MKDLIVAPITSRHHLSTGHIDLEVSKSSRLDLFRVAERQNPKRSFLFVSTVLGRHIPVPISEHRAVLRELSREILPHISSGQSPILVMSYAETAVGLGLGVFDELKSRIRDRRMHYLPTTRFCPSGVSPWFTIQEDHSHAVDHMVFSPGEDFLQDMSGATLVLVDDEATTGRTFSNLAAGLKSAGLTVSAVVLVTLNDWSAGSACRAVSDIFPHAAVSSVSMLSGRYTWTSRYGVERKPLPDPVPAGCPPWAPSYESSFFGVPRLGLDGTDVSSTRRAWDLHVDRNVVERLSPESRTLVVGTGENVWKPFMAAERMAHFGFDVSFISTTRSPVLKGDVISHQAVFPDHWGLGLPMYLNNVDPDDWDDIVLFTETPVSGISEDLRRFLGKGIISASDGVFQIEGSQT